MTEPFADTRTAQGRRVLTGISSRAWEHPADRAALQALRAVPGFDLVLRKLFGLVSERAIRLITLGSAVEVGPQQFPRIDALYTEVLAVLDSPKRFGLYVAQSPVVNAGAVGMDDPFIVLNSGTVALLTDDQLRVVLGHELGHILSDHVLYKTMLRLLLRVSRVSFGLPLTGIALLAVVAALLEWDRKSELSADRAALLAVQDPNAVRETLFRLAGGIGEGASVSAFADQAARYEEGGSAFDGVIKVLALLNRSHPFPVQRMRELDRWLDAGDYQRVLDGTWPLRADDPDTGAWQAWKDSAESYRDGFKSSADPLNRWVRETGAAAADKAGGLFGRFRKKKSGEEEEQRPGDKGQGSGARDDFGVDPDDIVDVDGE